MQNDLQETSHPDWCANNNVSFNLILITMSFHHSHPRNSPSICSISCCLSSVGWSSFPAHRCTENKKHVIIYASTKYKLYIQVATQQLMCTINYELYYSHALKIVVYLFQQMLILAILIPMLWRSKIKIFFNKSQQIIF